ncbi:ABC transporter permease [Niabella sp.]|uniref:ABC transporter permease n=1 Tax=Niabella sp. TaxID=1962976 RepID=UPI00263616C6|nr:ABC transporter permease [Niabella sp.]
MFKNFIKVAWRNLQRGKAYSVINILGLSIGMAVALLIALWIWDEVSYNHYFKNYATIAQVKTHFISTTKEIGTGDAVSIPIGNELRTKYGSDFKHVSMASWNFGHILAVGDKKIIAKGMWVEDGFPEMFSLKMLKGNRHALKDVSSVLLNESTAKALFGKEDPVGKTIKWNNKENFTVAGVYEDFPYNTTLKETMLLLPWKKYITTEDWLKNAVNNWNNHSFQCYVQVNNHINIPAEGKKIAKIAVVHKNIAADGDERSDLLPMDDWQLHSEYKNGKQAGGRIQYVYLFGMIGVFVLLLACINFMNLSTARSEKRAKEVGIRKAIGSLRSQLIKQFLSESMVVSFIALAVSIGLATLLLPFFNALSDKKMSIPWLNPWFWLLAVAFTIFTGLIAGSYPAFYLSRFNPVTVLKGTFRAGRYASLPREILVVIQFTISITLAIGTIIVFRQIQFTKNRPVGYTREGLVMIDMATPDLYGHYDAIRNDLLATGMVENMAESSSPATAVYSNQIGYTWNGPNSNRLQSFGTIGCTWEFGKTIGWQIKEGRDFSRDFVSDSSAVILNEAAVKIMGVKDIVGKIVWEDTIRHTVVGVIKDLVMESPYDPIKPTIFFMNPQWANVITIRVKPNVTMAAALPKIETVFKKYNPGAPFDYRFADQEYALKFSDEQRIGNIATFFAALAIFISCLGLFGLASFVAAQRTKEIGVRKVLGASVFNLWGMLSSAFLKLVIIASFIAIPIAWWGLYQWLQKYEYRTPITGWIFATAVLGSIAITIITVSFQAIKAAKANPVKSLRTE